jgi:hypothetical protein
MLSPPNLKEEVRRSERPTDVLAAIACAVYDRMHPAPLDRGDDPASSGWLHVADLLRDPDGLEPLIGAASARFRSQDRALLVAQVARETISALVTVAVELWGRQRRVLDLSAANVWLRAGETAVVVGVHQPWLAVLADDLLAGQPGVEVIAERRMFDRLVDQTIGYPVPPGAVPPGQPATIAAVAAIVAAVRRSIRCGERQLWGTAALAIASTSAKLAHAVGRRADTDRDMVFASRPDLARTVELIQAEADADVATGPVTFGLRRTCCLLFKLPDGDRCATCSLGDRDAQIVELTDWYRRYRPRQGCDGDGGAPGISSSSSSA